MVGLQSGVSLLEAEAGGLFYVWGQLGQPHTTPGVLGSTVSQWGVALLASVVNVTVV